MKKETITLGGGCFWCLEAAYQRVPGVLSVESGYTDGDVENPSYKAVCTGATGHAEVVQVTFDPREVSLEYILQVFWKIHDPTTLNRQGADVGTQYRSGIYYHSEAQAEEARRQMSILESEKVFPDPIVTELKPLGKYYSAEGYHQNYYNQNPNQGYCSFVIAPKLAKLESFLSK
ncbi:MAG: peptide-methionine (S)-S-oxide reductase MsrA [Opitutales bacterium]